MNEGGAGAAHRLLVINPNTSASVSRLLARQVEAVAPPGVQVDVVTAAFGAGYIADEATYAVAGHAVLEAWTRAAAAHGAPAAVLIACFGDPGLWALREVCPCPVVGLAEAAFEQAGQRGRFAVVTGGRPWEPILERLALCLGWRGHLAGVYTLEASGAQLAAEPAAARRLLGEACRLAAAETAAASVVLGGAGLAGYAAQLQGVPVPVLDSVRCGAEVALRRGGLGGRAA